MNQWNHNCYSKKKVRGLGRRLRIFSKYLNEQIDSLPVQNNKDPNYKGYTSLHIPFSMFYTHSKNVPINVKRYFVQKIVNKIQYLLDIRTETQKEYRIFCSFNSSDLDDSVILILFTKKGMDSFYEGFFSTEIDEAPFIRLHQTQNLENKWKINIPEGLSVKGYKPIDAEYEYENRDEIWFIGRLS
ncbi:DUF3916 domain-containing protein [Priestia megaterium]|uniref:DUF3916 domain-containing protein n=1 Tax=Priestia megaterium TaxID=1404 RepID=UPI001C5304DD|nr:DUF3916 domain-containing protein [Priestia megaterium]MBW0933581.1 DUF3916 domain-containing protein [Priestia megaterium]